MLFRSIPLNFSKKGLKKALLLNCTIILNKFRFIFVIIYSIISFVCSSAKRDELIIKFMEVETMREFKAQDIRNIAVLGHSGSGKTSFCEAVLYRAGVTKRLGSVDESNTVMDYSSEEKQRNISINLGVAAMEWQDTKVNLIDTPGDFDFLGEVNEIGRASCRERV